MSFIDEIKTSEAVKDLLKQSLYRPANPDTYNELVAKAFYLSQREQTDYLLGLVFIAAGASSKYASEPIVIQDQLKVND